MYAYATGVVGMVAERWKIEAVLAFVRCVPFEQFYIAGANDTVSKTYIFMNLICCRPSYVYEVVRSLEVRDYCKGPLPDTKVVPTICGYSEDI